MRRTFVFMLACLTLCLFSCEEKSKNAIVLTPTHIAELVKTCDEMYSLNHDAEDSLYYSFLISQSDDDENLAVSVIVDDKWIVNKVISSAGKIKDTYFGCVKEKRKVYVFNDLGVSDAQVLGSLKKYIEEKGCSGDDLREPLGEGCWNPFVRHFFIDSSGIHLSLPAKEEPAQELEKDTTFCEPLDLY